LADLSRACLCRDSMSPVDPLLPMVGGRLVELSLAHRRRGLRSLERAPNRRHRLVDPAHQEVRSRYPGLHPCKPLFGVVFDTDGVGSVCRAAHKGVRFLIGVEGIDLELQKTNLPPCWGWSTGDIHDRNRRAMPWRSRNLPSTPGTSPHSGTAAAGLERHTTRCVRARVRDYVEERKGREADLRCKADRTRR